MDSTVKVISSRPWLHESATGIGDLSDDELKLIASFLYVTRLGQGISPFRDAAFSLMTKIELLKDIDFLEDAANEVGLHACVTDTSGNVIDRVSYHNLEFEV